MFTICSDSRSQAEGVTLVTEWIENSENRGNLHTTYEVGKGQRVSEIQTRLGSTQVSRHPSADYWLLAGVIPYSFNPIRYASISYWTPAGSDPNPNGT